MATEIEHKFLVDVEKFWDSKPKIRCQLDIRQGYISEEPGRVVRVRIQTQPGCPSVAWLTIKGKRKGLSRPEFEYTIPLEDAEDMFDLCTREITKTRYLVDVESANRLWEVDFFKGENEGLVVAELEVPSEKSEFKKPSWAGRDVSTISKYSNSNLARKPFKTWKPN